MSYNRDLIERMAALGAHLVLVKRGVKAPVHRRWTMSPAISVDEAVAHVAAGGNLGANQALSRIVVLDAEDEAATHALRRAGFELTVATAKAQDPKSPKYGGSHVWLRVPDHIDSAALPSNRTGIVLPGGGKIDALAGARQMVVPPSAIDEAPGHNYAPYAGGLLDLDTELRSIPVAPDWLFDRATPAPAGLEPLAGILIPDPPSDRVEVDARSIELTERIDAVGWADWLDGDRRLTPTGQYDGCGCPIYHWQGADNEKSATLHDGCSQGCGVHVWSGTMMAQLGLPGDHVSRLDLACALRGQERRAVAASVGIVLGREREPLAPLTPAYYEQQARELEAAGDSVRAAEYRATAAAMAAQMHAPVLPSGEVTTSGRVAGGLASVVPIQSVTGATEHVAEPETSDDTDGTEAAAEARRVFAELRAKIGGIEHELAALTPGLRRVSDYAESEGVFMHGLLGALLPRIVQDVPPNVLLPPRNGLRSSKLKGQGVNQYVVQVAPSSAGKSESDAAAEAAIPLRSGVRWTQNGTSEAWSKHLRGRRDGEDLIKAVSLLIGIDEIAAFNAELERAGSKTAGWIASTWMNSAGGQDTSDEKNSALLPRHGSRIGIAINAQPSRMSVLLRLSDQGAGARFCKTLAGIVRSAERGPLYGEPVAPVLADQRRQPWYSTLPVGYPPAACQVSQEARDARLAAGQGGPPEMTNLPAGTFPAGVPGYDDAPPIWIDLPPAALEDIEAGLEVAAERAGDWGRAFEQDREGVVSGHRVPMQMHVAFAFAVLDGEWRISDAHWHAAGAFLRGSDLTMEACVAYMELSGEAEAYRAGHLKGVGQAAARAAESTVTSRGVQSAMRAIIRNLGRAENLTAMPGYVTGPMSRGQKTHAYQAAEALRSAGQLRFNLDGSWTLIP